MHHGLPHPACERLSKLGHILNHTVGAEFAWRVRIGLHRQSDLLGTGVTAPILREGQEEMLHGRVLILLCIQRDVLALGIFQERDECQAQPAVNRIAAVQRGFYLPP